MTTAAAPDPASELRPKAGGHATATLNYLASPDVLAEYVRLTHEIDALVERLERLARGRAQHEMHLLLAGVTRTQLAEAILQDGEAP